MSKPKYLDCPGCIGLSEEHTCPSYAAFESMRNAKDRCHACAVKDAKIERLRLVIENYRLGGRWKGSEIDVLLERNAKLQAVVDAAIRMDPKDRSRALNFCIAALKEANDV